MDTTYRILERRVFALPKIALFPAVVARHPRMAVIALPALLAVDALKGKVVARLSAKVEELRHAHALNPAGFEPRTPRVTDSGRGCRVCLSPT